MAQRRKHSTKAQSANTEGGSFVGNDINAGRDIIGRDYNVTTTTNIHHHYSATKTSSRSSHPKPDSQPVEANVVNTLIKFYHRWFPYTVLLVALQLVFLPLLFVITDLWPLLILPSMFLMGIFSFLHTKTEHLLTIADFYDKRHSVSRRTKLIHELRQRNWGHWLRNWYTSLLLASSVQVNKPRGRNR